MVPFGPQEIVFELESAAKKAWGEQTRRIAGEKKNRREASLSAASVNRCDGQVRCGIESSPTWARTWNPAVNSDRRSAGAWRVRSRNRRKASPRIDVESARFDGRRS